jgi:hypothetical protein
MAVLQTCAHAHPSPSFASASAKAVAVCSYCTPHVGEILGDTKGGQSGDERSVDMGGRSAVTDGNDEFAPNDLKAVKVALGDCSRR